MKNFRKINLRHLGNDVYSFTLKLKENRTNGLPLYVTDENTRFSLSLSCRIGVKLVAISSVK